ncbi:MAG: TetR/AcrR family transcriptional regulator, partial [Planctomycetota bacterium]
MAGTARKRLVQAGIDAFYQRGFHATGLDTILERAETTKTTFYKYFESKNDLALACIQENNVRWREMFPGLLEEIGGE